jgi:hypothetical protein
VNLNGREVFDRKNIEENIFNGDRGEKLEIISVSAYNFQEYLT